MRYDVHTVSSDSFMLNLSILVIKLALPVMKVTSGNKKTAALHSPSSRPASAATSRPATATKDLSPYDKINLRYVLQGHGGRIDYDNVTRLYACDIPALRERYPQESEYNVNTEIFFIATECITLGVMPMLRIYAQVIDEIQSVPLTRHGMSVTRRQSSFRC